MHRSHESEAYLVVFTNAGAITSAPYRVTDESHWALKGAGLRNGDVFGEKSLHERVAGGASGHETDKISVSSPVGVERIAQGTNEGEGGADLVHFKLGNGAVFSAGSITWVSSLFPDDKVSTITRNVLNRFMNEI
jgi:N,N-dimethylformamidase